MKSIVVFNPEGLCKLSRAQSSDTTVDSEIKNDSLNFISGGEVDSSQISCRLVHRMLLHVNKLSDSLVIVSIVPNTSSLFVHCDISALLPEDRQ